MDLLREKTGTKNDPDFNKVNPLNLIDLDEMAEDLGATKDGKVAPNGSTVMKIDEINNSAGDQEMVPVDSGMGQNTGLGMNINPSDELPILPQAMGPSTKVTPVVEVNY